MFTMCLSQFGLLQWISKCWIIISKSLEKSNSIHGFYPHCNLINLKGSTPNTITFGVRISADEFWKGNKDPAHYTIWQRKKKKTQETNLIYTDISWSLSLLKSHNIYHFQFTVLEYLIFYLYDSKCQQFSGILFRTSYQFIITVIISIRPCITPPH